MVANGSFLFPDPGHPCLADHGTAIPHQLVLTKPRGVPASGSPFGGLTSLQHPDRLTVYLLGWALGLPLCPALRPQGCPGVDRFPGRLAPRSPPLARQPPAGDERVVRGAMRRLGPNHGRSGVAVRTAFGGLGRIHRREPSLLSAVVCNKRASVVKPLRVPLASRVRRVCPRV